jgi:hypothetical protein
MNLRRIFTINTAVGLLFFIANGAAALAMIGGSGNWSTAQVWEASAFALCGFAVVVLGVGVLAGSMSMELAARWQSLMLGLLLVALVLWGLTLFVQGPNSESRVMWMAGAMSALALYVRHALINTMDPRAVRRFQTLLCAGCVAAIAVDVGVALKLGAL